MLADVNCVLTRIAVGGRGFPNGVRKREREREREREEEGGRSWRKGEKSESERKKG